MLSRLNESLSNPSKLRIKSSPSTSYIEILSTKFWFSGAWRVEAMLISGASLTGFITMVTVAVELLFPCEIVYWNSSTPLKSWFGVYMIFKDSSKRALPSLGKPTSIKTGADDKNESLLNTFIVIELSSSISPLLSKALTCGDKRSESTDWSLPI